MDYIDKTLNDWQAHERLMNLYVSDDPNSAVCKPL